MLAFRSFQISSSKSKEHSPNLNLRIAAQTHIVPKASTRLNFIVCAVTVQFVVITVVPSEAYPLRIH